MEPGDVNVEQLEDLVVVIRELWVGDTPSRAHDVRCGDIAVENVEGLGKITLNLRFPLPMEIIEKFITGSPKDVFLLPGSSGL